MGIAAWARGVFGAEAVLLLLLLVLVPLLLVPRCNDNNDRAFVMKFRLGLLSSLLLAASILCLPVPLMVLLELFGCPLLPLLPPQLALLLSRPGGFERRAEVG